MESRNTFVLLTVVLAFAVQCIALADVSATNTNTVNPAPAASAPAANTPAPANNPAPAVAVAANPAPANGSSPAANVAKTESAPLTPNNNASKLVEIEVYYEALCSDSVKFVSEDLLPVCNKLSRFINVTFIPFAQGNITVNTDNSLNFTCKREGECAADKVHACGINKIKDSEKLIKFVNCSLTEGFKSPNKTVPIDVCGKNSSIDSAIITAITNCSNSSESDAWLQDYKNKSSIAKVTFVPKILINKNSSENFTTNSFMQQVCKQIPEKDLPVECKTSGSGSDTLVIGVLPIIIGAFYFIKMI